MALVTGVDATGVDATGETSGGTPAPPPAPGDRLLEFVRPVIGWEESTRYALRSLGEQYRPYVALVSLDQPGLQFVVVPPGALFDDYVIEIPDADRALLDLGSSRDALVLVIVRRQGVPVPVVNLMGPIVVHRGTARAAQVILDGAGYGAAVPIDAGTARP